MVNFILELQKNNGDKLDTSNDFFNKMLENTGKILVNKKIKIEIVADIIKDIIISCPRVERNFIEMQYYIAKFCSEKEQEQAIKTNVGKESYDMNDLFKINNSLSTIIQIIATNDKEKIIGLIGIVFSYYFIILKYFANEEDLINYIKNSV